MRAYLGLFVWMLCLWAGSVQAGETFRFRVYLKDKGESGYTLDKPREFLSSEAIARRTRQGIALSPTDLPIAQAYLDTLSAHGGRPILTSKWFATVVVSTPDSIQGERLARLSIVDSVKWIWKGEESADASPRAESRWRGAPRQRRCRSRNRLFRALRREDRRKGISTGSPAALSASFSSWLCRSKAPLSLRLSSMATDLHTWT